MFAQLGVIYGALTPISLGIYHSRSNDCIASLAMWNEIMD
jgi:hypothetical protein